ncbi:protein O-mannosyl-transferase TMTC1 [Galendromus occidentalis]|uniref:dolichyl-phosphate-mannose--protein mannosyltransferase n=1 Tax=Galendromus occidentalis TaxID=34638 RepID=A0AAJ7SGM3_9ACAR|nr:protein O-mannosyl-transferase TMTC1 [Galendromus occidentalis]
MMKWKFKFMQRRVTETRHKTMRHPKPSPWRDRVCCAAAAASVTFLCFCFDGFGLWAPNAALDGELVHDDIVAIVRNPDVVNSDPGIDWYSLWTNDFWGTPMSSPASHKSFRPLTVLTFRLNYLVSGSKARGFHAVNVALHFVVCVLLGELARRMTRGLWSVKESLPLQLLVVVLFGVHPIHSEAVTSIVGRADLLCATFFLVALLLFIDCCDNEALEVNETRSPVSYLVSSAPMQDKPKQKVKLWLSMGFATLALFSKEQGITVLGLFVLYRLAILCKRGTEDKCYSVIHRILYAFTNDELVFTSCFTFSALMAYRVMLHNGTLPRFSEHDNPASYEPHFLTRTLTYSYLAAFNVGLMLYPAVLSYDWQMGSVPIVQSLWDVRNLATVALLMALSKVAWLIVSDDFGNGVTHKNDSAETLDHEDSGSEGSVRSSASEENDDFPRAQQCGPSLLLMSVALLSFSYMPASNVFVTVGFVVAERVLYIPSMGFCLLVVEGFRRTLNYCKLRSCDSKRCQKILLIFVIAFVVAHAARTLRRNQVWRSRATLFESGVRELPTNCKMHYNYANLQKDQGRFHLARKHYRIALCLCPNHASAHNNLGTVVDSSSEAEKHFRQAIGINLNHAGAHYNLGMLYRRRGQFELARALLERSLILEPSLADAVSSLADLECLQGRCGRAEPLHRKAIELDSESAPIRNNYASFLHDQGRLREASEQYKRAVALEPTNTAAIVNAAETMKKLHIDQEAEDLYRRALTLEHDPWVMDQLAVLYAKAKRFAEAEEMFVKISRDHPSYLTSRLHHAQMLMQIDDMDGAERVLQQAILADAGFRDGLRQIALLYSLTNRTMEAEEWIRKALRLCPRGAIECASLHADYGDILKDMSNLNRSAECYSEAIKLQPHLTHAHINLGVIRHLQGDYSSAFHHYTIAYSLEPNNTLVVENMEKLRKRILKSFRQHSTTIDAAFEVS